MANEKRLISYYVLIAHLDSCIERSKGLLKSVFVAIKYFVEQMPTVDAVEVVHGRWKAHKPDCRGYTAGFICSHCGNTIYTDYCMKECEYNYCPNCGADMMGDGDGKA